MAGVQVGPCRKIYNRRRIIYFENNRNNHRILAINAMLIRFNINTSAIEADPQQAIEQKIKNCLN